MATPVLLTQDDVDRIFSVVRRVEAFEALGVEHGSPPVVNLVRVTDTEKDATTGYYPGNWVKADGNETSTELDDDVWVWVLGDWAPVKGETYQAVLTGTFEDEDGKQQGVYVVADAGRNPTDWARETSLVEFISLTKSTDYPSLYPGRGYITNADADGDIEYLPLAVWLAPVGSKLPTLTRIYLGRVVDNRKQVDKRDIYNVLLDCCDEDDPNYSYKTCPPYYCWSEILKTCVCCARECCDPLTSCWSEKQQTCIPNRCCHPICCPEGYRWDEEAGECVEVELVPCTEPEPDPGSLYFDGEPVLDSLGNHITLDQVSFDHTGPEVIWCRTHLYGAYFNGCQATPSFLVVTLRCVEDYFQVTGELNSETGCEDWFQLWVSPVTGKIIGTVYWTDKGDSYGCDCDGEFSTVNIE